MLPMIFLKGSKRSICMQILTENNEALTTRIEKIVNDFSDSTNFSIRLCDLLKQLTIMFFYLLPNKSPYLIKAFLVFFFFFGKYNMIHIQQFNSKYIDLFSENVQLDHYLMINMIEIQ